MAWIQSNSKLALQKTWEAYHKINTFMTRMPSRIGLDDNKWHMNCIPFILNIMRETLFSIDHESNPKHCIWDTQECQQCDSNKFKESHFHLQITKSMSPTNKTWSTINIQGNNLIEKTSDYVKSNTHISWKPQEKKIMTR